MRVERGSREGSWGSWVSTGHCWVSCWQGIVNCRAGRSWLDSWAGVGWAPLAAGIAAAVVRCPGFAA